MPYFFYIFIFMSFHGYMNSFDCCLGKQSSKVIKLVKNKDSEILEFFKNKSISVARCDLDTLLSFAKLLSRFNMESFSKDEYKSLFDINTDDLCKVFIKGIFLSFDGTDVYLASDKDCLKENYENLKHVILWEGPNLSIIPTGNNSFLSNKFSNIKDLRLVIFSSDKDFEEKNRLNIDVYAKL